MNQNSKIKLNRELNTELIQQNSLSSTTYVYASQFRDKQKFQSAPKQRHQPVPKSCAADRLYCGQKA
jgi:hypothetical protein